MMAVVTGHGKIAKDICDALGLKHVVDLDIRIPLDGIITVIAKLYPEEDGVMKLPAIFKDYVLLPKKETVETTVMGDGIRTFREIE